MSTDRFFLSQDNSSHWYIVRADCADEWDRWVQLPEDDERSWVPPPFASEVGGSPGNITFTDPL